MARARILIADDEEGIRESLNLILSDEYELEFATDGQQTLEKLSREAFELALLDIKMPKLDGLEVLRRLKGNGSTTPILVLTAYQSVELAKEAVKLGALDYLPKPFEREQILNAVRGVLAHGDT
jgi:DNA-binding NtrC family response regulator